LLTDRNRKITMTPNFDFALSGWAIAVCAFPKDPFIDVYRRLEALSF
jgi:hypothetical protein